MIIGTPFLTPTPSFAICARKREASTRSGCLAPAARRRSIASRSPRIKATASAVFPFFVLGLQVRAQFDQAIHDVVPVPPHRIVQRCLPKFEPRHSAIERLRVLLHERSNQRQIPDRDRREDMVASTPFEQKRDTLVTNSVGRPDRRRPADDVRFMLVAMPMHIAPGIEQRSHHLDSRLRRGQVQGRDVDPGGTCVGIGAALEQHSHDLQVPAKRRAVQPGRFGQGRIRVVRVNQLGSFASKSRSSARPPCAQAAKKRATFPWSAARFPLSERAN